MKKLLTTLLITFSVIAFSQDVKDPQAADEGQRPKAEYKLGSAIVTVWVNKKSDGTTWKNFQVKKIYKKEGKWLSTNSFDETELLELKAVIDRVISEEAVTKE
ncbi:MAG: hypothetical protein RLN88_04515 [Ekhidna sp.]|uniref:hypothetical protein n=1 Tax=Ekhidna sp. TaxID=2608089 RepID=UPI0032ED2A39